MAVVELHLGDCLEVMAGMEADSVDSIVTDPPYGISFMSKNWDHGIPGIPFWEEALRVAKPGAMMLAFGGTRTSHRLACAIEDAGWEIRDTIMWLYASGFPKSANISKMLDRAAGKEREVVGTSPHSANRKARAIWGGTDEEPERIITAPATEAAKLWDGWGTALSPSHEPIIVAMKPRDGTFANNACKWGVAGLNIDGARIELAHHDQKSEGGRTGLSYGSNGRIYGKGCGGGGNDNRQGRWPKNTLFSHHPDCVQRGVRRVKSLSGGTLNTKDRVSNGLYKGGFMSPKGQRTAIKDADGLETIADYECVESCPVRMLDESVGDRPGPWGRESESQEDTSWFSGKTNSYGKLYRDGVNISRFFYTAKASRKERNLGLEGMEEKVNPKFGHGNDEADSFTAAHQPKMSNTHPTCKPLAIMRYLCKLTKTPTGGVVLDPFMGSGTTGMAAILEGRDFIGIEISNEYMEIAEKRIAWAQQQGRQLPLMEDVK